MSRGLHWSDDRGATMVEYGLMVLLVAVLIITLVQAMGLSVRDMFESVMDAFT